MNTEVAMAAKLSISSVMYKKKGTKEATSIQRQPNLAVPCCRLHH